MEIEDRKNVKSYSLEFSQEDTFRVLAEASVQSSTVQDLCNRFLQGLLKVLNFEYGIIRLKNEHANALDLIMQYGFNEKSIPKSIEIGRFEETGFYESHVAMSMKPLFIPEPDIDPILYKYPKMLVSHDVHSVTTWPMICSDEVIGTVCVATKRRVEYPDSAKQFFSTIISLFSTALKNKMVEIKSKHREALQREILTSFHGTLIILTDNKLNIIDSWFDKKLLHSYDISTNRLKDLNVMDLWNPNRKKPLAWFVRKVIHSKRPMRNEFKGLFPKGFFWFDVTISPVSGAGATPEYVVIFIQDITHLKSIEEKLRSSYKDLELYTSLLKHDMLNDLQVLLSLFESIEMLHPKDLRVVELVKDSRSSIDKMQKMLEIIDVKRLDTKINLIQIIRSAINEFKRTFVKINLTVDEEVREHEITVGRLFQFVISNIIRNAAKYAGSEPTIDIHVYIQKDSVVVDLIDDGPGIPKHIRNRLFNKGVSTRGTGLGLYLCRKVIEGYKGTLTLIPEKELARGAGFRIVLPLEKR